MRIGFGVTRGRSCLVACLVLTVVGGGSATFAVQGSASSAGLVAAYAFDEGTGTVLNDRSGNGNNGTIRGATWTTAGKFGGGLSFNAASASNWVTIPDAASLDLSTGMTLEAWVRPTTLGSYRTVLLKEQTGQLVYDLYASNDAGRPTNNIYVGGADRELGGTSALPLSTWTYLSATYDGTTQRLYVNGTQVASKAISGQIVQSTGALRIGGNSVWGEWFGGTIDEIRVYNRPLGAAEIQADMNTPVGAAADTTPPTAPAAPVVGAVTTTSAALSWTASTDNVAVAGYTTYLGATKVGSTTGTSYTFGGLSCGTSYTLGVEAFDAAGNVSARTTAAATTAPCPDTTPPSVPTGLTATAATQTSVGLSWNAATDNVGVTGYGIYQGSTLTGTTAGTSTTVTGLTCGTSYAFGVDAADAAGNRSAPATLTASTAACSADTTPPSAPSALSIGSLTRTGASATWTASTDDVGVAGYDVYVDTQPAGSTPSTSFAFSGLSCGTTYTFGVAAYDAAGNVSATTSATATTASCPDTTPPTVRITSPASGASVSGSVALSVAASDDVAVAGVQYKLDGVNLGSESLVAPFGLTWNTAQSANGSHVLTATARDSSGNQATSAAVTVTVDNSATATPAPLPPAGSAGITVGPGFTEASARQVVRTASNVVYVMTSDDNPCQTGGSGVIRIWKGTGAQAANASVPTGFAEQDAAHHPVSAGSGSCVFARGVTSELLSPDIRLDRSGTIHAAYIDGKNGNLYYQTFSTATNTWGARTVIATGAQTASGSSWPRAGQVALTLDANDVPHVAFASSGTSNAIRYTDRVGGAWSAPVTIYTGTNEMHPSMVTSLDGAIHLAWMDNALATHAVIKYAKYTGTWGPVETVSAGDTAVLANGDDDQGPSIATDLESRPHVLFMDGTVNGSDDYVRLRVRMSNGTWADNTPPGGAGGASNPKGTWFAHTPQNYISSSDAEWVFLGHDAKISPAGYSYQAGGVATAWSPYATLDPRNNVNTTAGEPGLDGSASVRFDPLRDNNPGLIDVLYYDENDGTSGYSHHATLYYKAVQIGSAAPPARDTTPPSVAFSAPAAGSTVSGSSVAVSASASDDTGVAGVQFALDGTPLGSEDTVAPYSVVWDSTAVSDGTHTLTATARDAAGNTATTTISVQTRNATMPPPDTVPPSVSITTPANNATVAGSVTLSASAADDVAVADVQFLLNGGALGAPVSVSPYTLTWDTTTVANGTYTLTARARDTSGNSTTSSAVTVVVGNAAPGTNLALGRPAVASSVETSSYPASLAVDGSTTTRWSSARSDPQWIYVDLGATHSINRVVLTWEAAYGKAYQIQVSDDAAAWTTIYSTSSGTGGTNNLTGLSGSGRYVRMYGTVRGTTYGYSLWELQVFGT